MHYSLFAIFFVCAKTKLPSGSTSALFRKEGGKRKVVFFPRFGELRYDCVTGERGKKRERERERKKKEKER